MLNDMVFPSFRGKNRRGLIEAVFVVPPISLAPSRASAAKIAAASLKPADRARCRHPRRASAAKIAAASLKPSRDASDRARTPTSAAKIAAASLKHGEIIKLPGDDDNFR